MKLRLFALASVAALGLFSTAASAATVLAYSPYQSAPNPGEMWIADFDSPIAAGYLLTGTAGIQTGTNSEFAAPAFGPFTDDATGYLGVGTGEFANISTPNLSEVSFYIGSLDTYNTITFTHQGGAIEAFTGAQLAALVPVIDANGNQVSPQSNGRYTFTFSTPVNNIRLDSSGDSFELDNFSTIAAVPEPTSWALMLIGFGGVGSLLRSRRRMAAAAAA